MRACTLLARCFSLYSHPAAPLRTGLNRSFPRDGTIEARAPDLLVIHSGAWDLQDHEPESLVAQIPQLLAILRRWLPKTQVLWIGPLQFVVTGIGWRTGFRAEQHAAAIARVLRSQNVPLINAHSASTLIFLSLLIARACPLTL